MRNLLFFASDFSIGLSSLLTDQLLALHTAGVNPIGIAGEKEQEKGLAKTLSDANVTLHRVKGLDEHKDFHRLVAEVEAIVDSKDIQTIHVQNNWQLAIAGVIKLRKRRKISIIYTLHGFRHNNVFKSIVARGIIGSGLFLLADHVIFMSDYLRKKFRLLSYKGRILPLGISNSFFVPSFQNPDITSLKLIFPAQFREGKNHKELVKEFGRYVTENNDRQAKLILPGDGPLFPEIQELVNEHLLTEQVILPGCLTKEEIRKLYLESNVAVITSNSETFGQAIAEPYVLGRCVISTPVGIAPEIIENGKNGFIIDEINQLPEVLKNLKNNMNLLCLMGRNNFKGRDMFKWDNIIKKYIASFL